MSFLSTIKETDLQILDKKVNEDGVWNAGEVVTFQVTDLMELEPDAEKKRTGGLFVKMKALDTEHEGARKSIFIKSDRKEVPEYTLKNHISLLATVLGKEKLASGDAKLSDAIGVKITAKAGKAKEFKGRMYQDFYDWNYIGKTDSETTVQEAVDDCDFTTVPL